MTGVALDHGVLRQILEREQRAALLQIVDQLLRHLAVIEIVGIGGDAFERLRQLGLLEDFARFVELAVALKDALRIGKLRQVVVAQVRLPLQRRARIPRGPA